MKLLLQGHDERYTVEQSLLNLFPGELPVYEPILPGDDSWAVVTLREEDDCCHVTTELRWQGRQTSHREVLPLSGTEYAREGPRHSAAGMNLLHQRLHIGRHQVKAFFPPTGSQRSSRRTE